MCIIQRTLSRLSFGSAIFRGLSPCIFLLVTIIKILTTGHYIKYEDKLAFAKFRPHRLLLLYNSACFDPQSAGHTTYLCKNIFSDHPCVQNLLSILTYCVVEIKLNIPVSDNVRGN
jgi:hypothetical protein